MEHEETAVPVKLAVPAQKPIYFLVPWGKGFWFMGSSQIL